MVARACRLAWLASCNFNNMKEFVRLALPDAPVTPMRLLKLVYFVEGWHLAFYDEALLLDDIQAWPYGPVVPMVYAEAKAYGGEVITGPLSSFATSSLLFDDGPVFCDPDDVRTRDLITLVFNAYKGLSDSGLSNLTHALGTPWRELYDKYDGKLPYRQVMDKAVIRDYFRDYFKKLGRSQGDPVVLKSSLRTDVRTQT